MNIATELYALEEKLLTSDFRRNREAVSELLAEEFREFGSSGRIWNKQEILDALKLEPPFEAAMEEFQVTEIAPGAVLATYSIIMRHSASRSRTSLRSSVWIRRSDGWKMIFHQGTAIPL